MNIGIIYQKSKHNLNQEKSENKKQNKFMMCYDLIFAVNILKEKQDFLTLFNTGSTFVLGFITILVALRQYFISLQQKQIALYEHRYNKIYKLILDNISECRDLTSKNKDINIHNTLTISKKFNAELDYARFLIKKKDFDKVIKLHNEITEILLQQHDDIKEKEWQEVIDIAMDNEERIEKLKKRILDTIIPYLQIEKERSFTRLLHDVIFICGIISLCLIALGIIYLFII